MNVSPNLTALNEGILSRVRARGIPETIIPLRPEEGFDYWVAWIRKRIVDKWDAVLIVSGPEGCGKSTLALQLAYAIDGTFNLKDRLCYTASDVIQCFKTVDSGKAAIFDESARALLGTDTFSKEQKALVQALMLIREKGLVTILCIPRVEELAKSMRTRRATLWIHVYRRGKGLVHVRDDRLRYHPDPNDFGFARDPKAPLLTFNAYPEDSSEWREYLAVKKTKLDEYLEETSLLLQRRTKRFPPVHGKSPEERRKFNRERRRRQRSVKKAQGAAAQ